MLRFKIYSRRIKKCIYAAQGGRPGKIDCMQSILGLCTLYRASLIHKILFISCPIHKHTYIYILWHTPLLSGSFNEKYKVNGLNVTQT
jgi:hypothetical protein